LSIHALTSLFLRVQNKKWLLTAFGTKSFFFNGHVLFR